MARKTARNLTGWEWRTSLPRGVKQRRRKIKFDTGYMDFTIARMQEFEAEHRLEEAAWEVEKEWEYGEEIIVMSLKGWSDATEEEIAEEVAKLNERIDQQDARDRKTAEDLKARRPDLFE